MTSTKITLHRAWQIALKNSNHITAQKKGLSGPFSLVKYSMTKKLESLFNLPEMQDGTTTEEVQKVIAENRGIITQVDEAIDKIDTALPTINDLDTLDSELDELAKLAKDKAEDLLDLGMNVDPRFGGVIFQTASVLLGHSISAKTAKMDRKLRTITLQLQKARLDHQIAKDMNKGEEEDPVDGKGMLLDRNALLAQILEKNKKQ